MRVENLPYILFTADEGVIEMKFEIEISKGKLAILQLIGSIWLGLNASILMIIYAPSAWWSYNLLFAFIALTIWSAIDSVNKITNNLALTIWSAIDRI